MEYASSTSTMFMARKRYGQALHARPLCPSCARYTGRVDVVLGVDRAQQTRPHTMGEIYGCGMPGGDTICAVSCVRYFLFSPNRPPPCPSSTWTCIVGQTYSTKVDRVGFDVYVGAHLWKSVLNDSLLSLVDAVSLMLTSPSLFTFLIFLHRSNPRH